MVGWDYNIILTMTKKWRIKYDDNGHLYNRATVKGPQGKIINQKRFSNYFAKNVLQEYTNFIQLKKKHDPVWLQNIKFDGVKLSHLKYFQNAQLEWVNKRFIGLLDAGLQLILLVLMDIMYEQWNIDDDSVILTVLSATYNKSFIHIFIDLK